jgi:flagellar hook-associated protein FlgK
VASDTLFLACGLFICSYFKYLQNNLKNLKPSDANSKINEIVEEHNQILKLFKDLNKAFAPIIFGKCMMGAILICVLEFQLLVVSFF